MFSTFVGRQPVGLLRRARPSGASSARSSLTATRHASGALGASPGAPVFFGPVVAKPRASGEGEGRGFTAADPGAAARIGVLARRFAR